MANTFKNAAIAATGTTLTDAYTAGSGVTATVIGLTCANVSSTNPILVTIKFYDSSANCFCFSRTWACNNSQMSFFMLNCLFLFWF